MIPPELTREARRQAAQAAVVVLLADVAELRSRSFRHGLWLGIATQPVGWLLAKLLHWLGVI